MYLSRMHSGRVRAIRRKACRTHPSPDLCTYGRRSGTERSLADESAFLVPNPQKARLVPVIQRFGAFDVNLTANDFSFRTGNVLLYADR
jgi:hypothetical protein